MYICIYVCECIYVYMYMNVHLFSLLNKLIDFIYLLLLLLKTKMKQVIHLCASDIRSMKAISFT